MRCKNCESARLKSILEGPRVHVVCEHCGFLEEEHHITPGRGGLIVTLRLLVKALERRHFEDIPEIAKLIMVEFVFLLHSYFARAFKAVEAPQHESLAFWPAFLVVLVLWTLPAFAAFYLGHELVAVALGILGLYFGINFTLKAVGTHL